MPNLVPAEVGTKPLRVLLVAPSRRELDFLVANFPVSRRVVLVKRVVETPRDVDALAGMEFDAIGGLDTLPVSFRAHLIPRVR